MKMRQILIFLLIGVLLHSQTALSETTSSYEVIEPTYYLINGEDYVRENMLTETLYVSADEIYFAGTSDEGAPGVAELCGVAFTR